MSILLQLLLLVLGLAVLLKGADYLVGGAVGIARIFAVPTVLIGLTVVSFGTSTPELLTAFTSLAKDAPELFLGDNIGSNITNISLVLGVAALIHPLKLKSHTVWKEIPFALLGVAATLIFALRNFVTTRDFASIRAVLGDETRIIGRIDQADGLVLLLFFGVFLYYTFSLARKEPLEAIETVETPAMPLSNAVVLLLIGIAGLGLGSNLLVSNALSLAASLGVNEGVIGLTIIAFGTSAPELAATVAAARKQETDLLVGNIIGSNIFNTFFVLGLTASVQALDVNGRVLLDLLVMLIITLFLFGASHLFGFRRITKLEGGILLLGYFGYLGYLFL